MNIESRTTHKMSYMITKDTMKVILLKFRNKRQRDKAFLLYAHIFNKYYNKGKKNLLDEQNYFELPSSFLKSISGNYTDIMKVFIEYKVLEYKKIIMVDSDGVVNEKKDYYNPRGQYSGDSKKQGRAMKYRFVKDPEKDATTHWVVSEAKKKRWYDITLKSLQEIGYENIKITRANYDRRVYHSAIRDYKTRLKGHGIIDSITSHPRLIYLFMKENKIYDEDYMNIFDKNLDFYNELVRMSDPKYLVGDIDKDRLAMKKIFASWINGNEIDYFGFKYLFPVLYNYVFSQKHLNYKNLGRNLTLFESKIWIDDLLENIPVDFALSVHDCLIVKDEDLDLVHDYCQKKYPDLRFNKKII